LTIHSHLLLSSVTRVPLSKRETQRDVNRLERCIVHLQDECKLSLICELHASLALSKDLLTFGPRLSRCHLAWALAALLRPYRPYPLVPCAPVTLGDVNKAFKRWQLKNHRDMCASMNARMNSLREANPAARKARIAEKRREMLEEDERKEQEERRREEARKDEERRREEEERQKRRESARRKKEERKRAEDERAQELRAHEDGLRSLISSLSLRPGGEGIPARYDAIICAISAIRRELGAAEAQLLTREAPGARPSADEAAGHAFFRPLLQHRQAKTSKCCIAAFCDGQLLRQSQGVVCGEGHFTCKDCLEGHVQSLSNEELRLLRWRDGKCLCPMWKGELGCTAGPFSDPELYQAVSATAFEGYIAGRMKVLEVHLREEIELEIERRYDERRYAEHGGTQSIGDLEQLKDELKKEMAQHEQTKQDLEKAQTKISAMSALLANV